MSFEDIKAPLKKVLIALQADRSKIARYTNGHEQVNSERLDQAIGNHMCDDNPEWFCISQHESHMIRQYFHENGSSYGWREYILLFHNEFPDLMDSEDPRYLRDTNESRKKKGLSEIVL